MAVLGNLDAAQQADKAKTMFLKALYTRLREPPYDKTAAAHRARILQPECSERYAVNLPVAMFEQLNDEKSSPEITILHIFSPSYWQTTIR